MSSVSEQMYGVGHFKLIKLLLYIVTQKKKKII